jgi:uncharacterized protein YjcR
VGEEKNIVDEAYAAPCAIKRTAHKYGIQPNLIRKRQKDA